MRTPDFRDNRPPSRLFAFYRHGLWDWLIGLLIYRHGLRVSEACDLRWDDLDLPKRTIAVRRLKGSVDSVHYLERDELAGLKRLHREQDPESAYVHQRARAVLWSNTRRLQHYLGHASITNTVKYTAMSPEPFKDIWR